MKVKDKLVWSTIHYFRQNRKTDCYNITNYCFYFINYRKINLIMSTKCETNVIKLEIMTFP